MTTPETATVPEARLRVVDRCDACRARAYVEVATPAGSFLLCGHHYTRHQPKIVANDYLVHDESYRIEQESA